LHGHPRPSGGHCRQVTLCIQAGKTLAHQLLAERICLAFDDADRVSRALAQAGPQAVAVGFGHEPGLAVADFDCSLGTSRHALPAAVTLLFVNYDDLAISHSEVLSWC